MRRQFSCSKCGFACASTWRNLNASKVVICNTCRSKGGKGKNKSTVNAKSPNYQPVNEAVNINLSRNSSSDRINPSGNSIMHQNVALPITQIGKNFGNLPSQPTLAFPLIAHGKSQDPKVKTEVFTADDDCENGGQRHFYCGKSTTSVLGDCKIQIKQEYDEEETIAELARKQAAVTESNKIKKKKRSKLPQYTLSPLARFINQLQLQHVCRRLPPRPPSPKYDDVLIYEKCKYVGENEVGLGAKLLLPPPLPPASSTGSTVVIKQELLEW